MPLSLGKRNNPRVGSGPRSTSGIIEWKGQMTLSQQDSDLDSTDMI